MELAKNEPISIPLTGDNRDIYVAKAKSSHPEDPQSNRDINRWKVDEITTGKQGHEYGLCLSSYQS
ncbi:hypothetical protein DPMN_150991 [Dreissena polymorpha]|uniref:Uncharacterized protein n=1 Tax=Dreissena polymorpha TaxID=45954 RepID=A0A9D4FES3_DREPO|nr:hypothetical protein DPMN_150991 [Dreissena polymorpha]